MTRQEVRLALRERLLELDTSVPGLLPAYREWENVHLGVAPPDRGYWLRETLLWNGEEKIGSVDHQADGIVQYTVFGPLGVGLKELEDLADAIKHQFRPGKTPSPGNGSISVFRAETGRGGRDLDGQWWLIPVAVYWRITRPPT